MRCHKSSRYVISGVYTPDTSSPKSYKYGRKEEKMKEKKPQAITSNPSRLGGGRSYRAAKWWVSTGRANSLQDMRLHTDR
jgi:hypothetical protein